MKHFKITALKAQPFINVDDIKKLSSCYQASIFMEQGTSILQIIEAVFSGIIKPI
jgi:hypothetical protein